MRTTLMFTLAALGLCTEASAQQIKQFQLVGFTQATFTGDAGVLGFTQTSRPSSGRRTDYSAAALISSYAALLKT